LISEKKIKSPARISEDIREARVSTLQRKLAESGQRTTPQRVHILRALLETQTHPTAEEVWERVRRVSPTTSLATVYKTLDTLIEIGEVIEVDARDDRHHFDAHRPKPHPHVICTRCGRIEDVDVEGLAPIQEQAALRSGYHIDEHRLTFFGVCRDCADKTAIGNRHEEI
jgi:Fur family peroxide stress response transcriptional regulator